MAITTEPSVPKPTSTASVEIGIDVKTESLDEALEKITTLEARLIVVSGLLDSVRTTATKVLTDVNLKDRNRHVVEKTYEVLDEALSKKPLPVNEIAILVKTIKSLSNQPNHSLSE